MKPTIYSLCILLMFLLGSPVHAARHNGQPQGISKQQAMNIAQHRHPGRVLGIKQKGQAYRVRIIDDNGEVHTLLIDAQSGEVIRR